MISKILYLNPIREEFYILHRLFSYNCQKVILKILVDDQFFSQQIYGGISRYHYELYSHLNLLENTQCEISALYTHNEYLKKDSKFSNPLLSPFFLSQKITRALNREFSIYKLKKQDFDVFHPTYYNPYFLPYLKYKPFVITIHDLIPEYFPKYFENTTLLENKKKLIEKADAIIAVSSNTKKDLVNFYQINENKIHVIHHGFKPEKVTQTKVELKLPSRFILYVGERGDYKNFNFFIESAAPVLINHNIHLLCAGGRKFTDAETKIFEKLHIKHLTSQFSVSDEELYAIYSQALLFVFPTLYEGFGIPILEAFYNKCPVVASNKGSIPEIARDGAIYFDPTNANEIAYKLNSAMTDSNLLDNLKMKGSQIVQSYVWEKTAIETHEVYKSVI